MLGARASLAGLSLALFVAVTACAPSAPDGPPAAGEDAAVAETRGEDVLADGASTTTDATPRAVIVDQLSLTVPNPDFVADATEQLEAAGYTVDYFPGEEVTVEAYRGLPAAGYDFVLLRVHSARLLEGEELGDDVALFTGELIDLRKFAVGGVPEGAATAVAEELERLGGAVDATGRERFTPEDFAHLVPAVFTVEGAELPFFGLRPGYVRERFEGRFKDGAIVVLMGCDGLRSPALAEAFVDRGVSTFVSWDEPVLATHTDEATLDLLTRLLAAEGGADPARAVDAVNEALGRDPQTGARLVVYP
jgi:hypothetical protein